MSYLNCPSCRLTVYTATSRKQPSECPRCGKRLGAPGRLFKQIRKFQQTAGGGRRGPLPPAA
jgi:hypothetical protein